MAKLVLSSGTLTVSGFFLKILGYTCACVFATFPACWSRDNLSISSFRVYGRACVCGVRELCALIKKMLKLAPFPEVVEKPAEPECPLLQIEHQHVVLHVVAPNNDRRRFGHRRRGPHFKEREAHGLFVHGHQRTGAGQPPVPDAIEHHVDLCHALEKKAGGERGCLPRVAASNAWSSGR